MHVRCSFSLINWSEAVHSVSTFFFFFCSIFIWPCSFAAYSQRHNAFKNGHNCLPRFLRAFGDTKNIIIRARNFNVLHKPVSHRCLIAPCEPSWFICEKSVCEWTAWALHCWNVWFILLFSSKVFHLLHLLYLRNWTYMSGVKARIWQTPSRGWSGGCFECTGEGNHA